MMNVRTLIAAITRRSLTSKGGRTISLDGAAESATGESHGSFHEETVNNLLDASSDIDTSVRKSTNHNNGASESVQAMAFACWNAFCAFLVAAATIHMTMGEFAFYAFSLGVLYITCVVCVVCVCRAIGMLLQQLAVYGKVSACFVRQTAVSVLFRVFSYFLLRKGALFPQSPWVVVDSNKDPLAGIFVEAEQQSTNSLSQVSALHWLVRLDPEELVPLETVELVETTDEEESTAADNNNNLAMVCYQPRTLVVYEPTPVYISVSFLRMLYEMQLMVYRFNMTNLSRFTADLGSQQPFFVFHHTTPLCLVVVRKEEGELMDIDYEIEFQVVVQQLKRERSVVQKRLKRERSVDSVSEEQPPAKRRRIMTPAWITLARTKTSRRRSRKQRSKQQMILPGQFAAAFVWKSTYAFPAYKRKFQPILEIVYETPMEPESKVYWFLPVLPRFPQRRLIQRYKHCRRLTKYTPIFETLVEVDDDESLVDADNNNNNNNNPSVEVGDALEAVSDDSNDDDDHFVELGDAFEAVSDDSNADDHHDDGAEAPVIDPPRVQRRSTRAKKKPDRYTDTWEREPTMVVRKSTRIRKRPDYFKP